MDLVLRRETEKSTLLLSASKVGVAVILKDTALVCVEGHWWFNLLPYQWHSDNKLTRLKRCSVSLVTSASARNGHGWAHKIQKVSIFMMGGKGLGVELGGVTSLRPWSHTTAIEMEVSWFGEGSPWLGGHAPRLPGECHWALLQRQCPWACCCSRRQPWCDP